MSILNESIPPPPSPERPPLAPYDPPEPAPQAAAWRRALKVVLRQESSQRVGLSAPREGSSRHYERHARVHQHHPAI
jgi:hypothetical protein